MAKAIENAEFPGRGEELVERVGRQDLLGIHTRKGQKPARLRGQHVERHRGPDGHRAVGFRENLGCFGGCAGKKEWKATQGSILRRCLSLFCCSVLFLFFMSEFLRW